MAFQNFPDINQESVSDLGAKIHEFEHRKAGTFTFFERCCAKKPDKKRREIFFRLGDIDWDFNEGSFYGPDAERSFVGIYKMGFSSEWTKALRYAYWFSTSKERKALKGHIIAGAVATRPELDQIEPNTDLKNISTAELGKQLYTRQNSFVWPFATENALSILAQERISPADNVVQVIKMAQDTTKEKGLNAGVQSLVKGLLPCFFRQEQNALKKNTSAWPSYEILEAIVKKKERIEPYLKNFSWLYLTQGKFYQDMEVRNFLENMPQKPTQMLLPLSFGRERSE